MAAGIFGDRFSCQRRADRLHRGCEDRFAARLTLAPINREVNGVHQVVHFGASWRDRDQAEHLRSGSNGPTGGVNNPLNDQPFQYRARGADLHLADRFVSTPAIFDHDTFWGLEGLVIWQSLHIQAEYSQLECRRYQSPFQGVQTRPILAGISMRAWFITGETNEYNKDGWAVPRSKIRWFGAKAGAGALGKSLADTTCSI